MKKITRNICAVAGIAFISLTATAQVSSAKPKYIGWTINPQSTIGSHKQKKSKQPLAQATAAPAAVATTYLTVGSVVQAPCSTDFIVSFTVSNPGDQAITGALVNYTIDGTAGQYPWVGNLAANTDGTAMTITIPNTATGAHTLSASITSVTLADGTTQQIPAETYDQAFTINPVLTTPAPTVTIRIQPDDFPDEISWELKNANGGVEASGGNYSSDPAEVGIINVEVPVNVDGCYTFTIFDQYHDGICCGDNGQGYYQIISATNQVIHTGGQYTESDTVSFGITEQVAGTRAYSFSDVKVYPNPAAGFIYLQTPTGIALPESYAIYNSLGQVVNRGTISQYNQQLDVAAFTGGIYFIKIDSGNASKTIQFIKG